MISIFNGKEGTPGISIHKAKMLTALHSLKGAPLAVFLAYWFHRAEDHYPTTRDLSEDTGYTRMTVSKAYSTLIARKLVQPPVCPQCHNTVPLAKFHRHHTQPGKPQYTNICIRCHNKAQPR